MADLYRGRIYSKATKNTVVVETLAGSHGEAQKIIEATRPDFHHWQKSPEKVKK